MRRGMLFVLLLLLLYVPASYMCMMLVPSVLSAQEQLTLEGLTEEGVFITYLSGAVDVDRTPQNGISDFEIAELDMELPSGCVIRTGRSSLCEITIPQRSVIRLASGSSFEIVDASVDTETGRVRERFNFFAGKFRAKVEKFTVRDSEFTVASGTTLAGVRGTELGGAIRTGDGADFFCFEGEVVIKSAEDVFEPVVLNAGEMSYVPQAGAPSGVQAIPQETLKQWRDEFATVEETAAAQTSDEWLEESWEPVEKQAQKDEAAFSFAVQLGTLTAGSEVYSALALMPSFAVGKFGIGLYLPAIVPSQTGFFGFNEWYNRSEWDFENLQDGVGDALLKIRYIRWGEEGDPLFLQAGGIDGFTLGHGFIVDGYSNTPHFPLYRRTGLRFDLDTDRFGFETMIADLSRFQLIGGRIYTRPLGRALPFAVGITVVRDRPLPSASPNILEEPNIFLFGADAELPVFGTADTGAASFGLTVYADGATMGYLYPELPASLAGKTAGATIGFVPGAGMCIGLKGNVGEIFTFRAEYRLIFGYFEPGLINESWEKRRLVYGTELEGLISDTSYKDDVTSGLLAEGGVLLFNTVSLDAGFSSYTTTRYSLTESKNVPYTVKGGMLSLGIEKGAIRRFSGSISYRREDGLETVFQQPLDAKTRLDAEVSYEFAPQAEVSFFLIRSFRFNEQTLQHEPVDTLGVRTTFAVF
ncbi:MAG: FecR domain-containing protein [Spirochaetes bacterium]|nr:FecR domain-containing protein [Spirochaetota bacterium]